MNKLLKSLLKRVKTDSTNYLIVLCDVLNTDDKSLLRINSKESDFAINLRKKHDYINTVPTYQLYVTFNDKLVSDVYIEPDSELIDIVKDITSKALTVEDIMENF